MDDDRMTFRHFRYDYGLISLFVFVYLLENVEGLAVSKIYHIQFCNGERMNISCPKDWQIHISSSYYVYVHGVHQGGATCRRHFNSSKQCLRKVQFFDPEYYSLMIQSCQSKQRCDEGLKARIGDPKVCWDYPPSPSDYLTFSYVCVNVHLDQSTTSYFSKPRTPTIASKPHGSTKPSGITGKPHSTTRISYPSTTWPWTFRTTSYGRRPVATSTVGGGQQTRMLVYTSTVAPVRLTSSYPATSSLTHGPTVRTTEVRTPKRPVASSKTEAVGVSDKLMAVATPIAVIAMIGAIVTIAAVIACRSPNKKSPLKRKPSQNSSVYYNHADRHSLGGDSVQTRASIHGIVNLGYDVTDKSFNDVAYVGHVILNAHEPDVTSDPEAELRLPAKEPLAEQVYSNYSEIEPNCNYI